MGIEVPQPMCGRIPSRHTRWPSNRGQTGLNSTCDRSRDGVIVIHHDDRPSPDARPFVELDFDEIRAATPWVPTLDEAWGRNRADGPAQHRDQKRRA